MAKNNKKYEWNLKQLYVSLTDPNLEKDMSECENLFKNFSDKWNTSEKSYLRDDAKLLEVLKEYEKISRNFFPKPLLYLFYITALDGQNNKAQAILNLYQNRISKASNYLTFFDITLGKIPKEKQLEILSNNDFSQYKFFLECIFNDARYLLSESEEKIMNLKSLTSSQMWEQSNDKILSGVTVKWKGKDLPLPEAQSLIQNLSSKDRPKLAKIVNGALKQVSVFSEAEINALVTDKKINDELRGYSEPYENTVRHYRNDPKVVLDLVESVTDNFSLSNKFYKLKAKLLKQKQLGYYDRNAEVGNISGRFDFEESKKILSEVFGKFDKKYVDILNSFIKNGQIDVFPRKGKRGGAFCSHSDVAPTFVMLNHINDFNSLSTFAHEMGHAFHSELTKAKQTSLYSNYSTSLAEVASTFFETLVFDAVVEKLPEKYQIIALHQKISDDISTIFRQVACFNYERDIHALVREKGMLSKEELALLHNKHMKAYMGQVLKFTEDDGYFFVSWSHLRSFFYVYTYAYGQLVSKALLKKYRENPDFRENIERYLSAGGKDTPENILKEIGLDVTSGKVFEEGIEEIKRDINRLEKMMR